MKRKLKSMQDCSDIIHKDQCKSFEYCRWCRSQAVDDGCFHALDARMLPIQVFDCTVTQ
ncbi:hypothetical protein KP509_17G073100 [Ceratopteris richardii]|nr:hypothetical protein KP509_17G073100 [Ceratopteris richardii]